MEVCDLKDNTCKIFGSGLVKRILCIYPGFWYYIYLRSHKHLLSWTVLDKA